MKKNNDKVKIMLIDDDDEMHEIYKSFFNKQEDKYDVSFFKDARIAFRHLDTNPADLIILDLVMPAMSGESFFACLRTTKEKMSIPVLVVTVLPPQIKQNIEDFGHFDYLQKPISEEVLFEKIQDILNKVI